MVDGVSKNIEVILHSDSNNNYITTTAIGEPYSSDFKRYSMPSWKSYCKKYGLGLAIVTKELISTDDKYYKKVNWQKFLVGTELKTLDILVNNICHLDTDILISPIAPNIFDFHHDDKISVISLRKNLPFSYGDALKKIAYFRNKYYDHKYPLDSALFISVNDLYSHHNLNVPKIADETCSGVYVYNSNKYSDFFENFFYSYTQDIDTITNGGDQTHFNYHVLNRDVNFLSYKFQAIWVFELATKYSFLYDNPTSGMIKKCIEATLLDNYFLHFAGAWHESNMWKIDDILNKENAITFQNFYQYSTQEVSGAPIGMIKP
tara:strand:+ start:476 stop:1432 length:957 start_codon:yes stop_codon:yes gene_type:complete